MKKNYVAAFLMSGLLCMTACAGPLRKKKDTKGKNDKAAIQKLPDITIKNLAGLAQPPKSWESTLKIWEKQNIQGLKSAVVWRSCDMAMLQGAERRQDFEVLFGNDFSKNKSRNSYVFQGPTIKGVGPVWVKISGKMHRWNNIRESQGRFLSSIDPAIDFNPGYCKEKTYQTASIVANSLYVRALIQQRGYTCCVIPACYVVKLNKKAGVEDNNIYALQEPVEGFRQINARGNNEDRALMDSLPVEIVQQMYAVVQGSGVFWDEGKFGWNGTCFAVVDLEQPSKTAPSEFYRKNMEKIALNRRLSLRNFFNLFGKESQQRQVLLQLLDADTDLNNAEKEFVRDSGL